jgi:hypothetical protein
MLHIYLRQKTKKVSNKYLLYRNSLSVLFAKTLQLLLFCNRGPGMWIKFVFWLLKIYF